MLSAPGKRVKSRAEAASKTFLASSYSSERVLVMTIVSVVSDSSLYFLGVLKGTFLLFLKFFLVVLKDVV